MAAPVYIDVSGNQYWGILTGEPICIIIDSDWSRTIIGFELHREEGPAIVNADGTHEWFFHNERHRVDGPAFFDPLDGHEEWFLHGRHHRIGGAAVIYPRHKREWWENGKFVREDRY